MLIVASSLWLANNREIKTRISPLTLLAWKIKERNVIDDVTIAVTTAVHFYDAEMRLSNTMLIR